MEKAIVEGGAGAHGRAVAELHYDTERGSPCGGGPLLSPREQRQPWLTLVIGFHFAVLVRGDEADLLAALAAHQHMRDLLHFL